MLKLINQKDLLIDIVRSLSSIFLISLKNLFLNVLIIKGAVY